MSNAWATVKDRPFPSWPGTLIGPLLPVTTLTAARSLHECGRGRAARGSGNEARGALELDPLCELDAGFDRGANRAGRGDFLQALELLVAQIAAQTDQDLEPARRRAMVVVDVDGDVAQIPVLRAPVHHERGGDTRGECRWKELVRRWSAALSAERFRFVGGQTMRAVDQELLPKRPGNGTRGCREAHSAPVIDCIETPSHHPSAHRSITHLLIQGFGPALPLLASRASVVTRTGPVGTTWRAVRGTRVRVSGTP